jgi:hypothetical protein
MTAFEVRVEKPDPDNEGEFLHDRMIVEADTQQAAIAKALAAFGDGWADRDSGEVPHSYSKGNEPKRRK